MNRSSIQGKLTELLHDLAQNNIAIKEHTRLIHEVGLNSVTMIEFIVLLEQHFNIRIKNEEILPQHFDTIGKVEDFVFQKMAGKKVESDGKANIRS